MLLTLPTSLVSHLASFLPLCDTFTHLAPAHATLHRALTTTNATRACFDNRPIKVEIGRRFTPIVRSAVRSIVFTPSTTRTDEECSEDGESMELVQLFPNVHSFTCNDMNLSSDLVPCDRMFLSSDSLPLWPLHSLIVRSNSSNLPSDTWVGRMLPMWSSTLRILEVCLTSNGSNATAEQMGRIVYEIVQANLAGLESLKLEQENPKDEEEDQDHTSTVDSNTLSSTHRFDVWSRSSQDYFGRLCCQSPQLHTLHLSFFHPEIVFPHHSHLRQLRTLHYLGLLTFDSLPHLACFDMIEHLTFDFEVDQTELETRWNGRWRPLQKVKSIRIEGEEEEEEEEQEQEENENEDMNQRLSASDTVDDAHASPVTRNLFRALACWSQLHSMLLQSTLATTNYCFVNMSSFASLKTLTHLNHLQFSCLYPSRNEFDLSFELDRLCHMIPSLKEIILNIEREDVDGVSSHDGDDTPSSSSTPPLAVTRHPRTMMRSDAGFGTSKLKKLGIWDGMAKIHDNSNERERASQCILTNIGPLLSVYSRLHSLSLIYCQTASFQPLSYLADSLVSLCLYFSRTPTATDVSIGTTPTTDGRSSSLSSNVVESDLGSSDENIDHLGCLTRLGWLILHGSGDSSSCFSHGQLIQLGRVIDRRLTQLRNLRLEHQPAMTASVWNAWVRPSEMSQATPVRFATLQSLSLKNCVHFDVAGQRALLGDVTRSLNESCFEAVILPRLIDLNLLGTFPSEFDSVNELLLMELYGNLEMAEEEAKQKGRHVEIRSNVNMNNAG